MSPRGLFYPVLFNMYSIGNFIFCGRVAVKTFEKCDPNGNYLFDFNVTFKNTDNNVQVVDGLMIFKAPVDNTVQSSVVVEMLVGKSYMYLLTINEKKSCDALHKYFGEFFYDLERNAQILPGVCPIQKGRYRLHNYRLDFRKMPTMANFPLGNLRFTDHVYTNRNNTFCCIVAEIDNIFG